MAVYGFASGLPFPLSGITLRQWMADGGLTPGLIGLTANLGMSYSLKFLWAPLLDRAPPFGLARFGRRRGWLAAIQPLLVASCVLLALSDPHRAVGPCFAAAALVALLSATQDVAIDAWRIESYPARRQGAALAAYVWGYRIALLASVSGAFWTASRLGWHGSLLVMAGLASLGLVGTAFAPESRDVAAPRGRGFGAALAESVAAPLRDLLGRHRAVSILAFIALFKLGEVLAGGMAIPFYRDLGFDRDQVARALFLPRLLAAMGGVALGGWLVSRLGARRALVWTGFVQMASMGAYFALAASGGQVAVLHAKVVIEALAEGMADAAFLAFLSGLCTPALAATQYALLSSVATLGLHTVGGVSGRLAQALGWVPFYGLSVFAALPAMLIMVFLIRPVPASVQSGRAGQA